MAELDYAFLAEYAQAKDGALTVIGASFTEAEVPQFPTVMDVFVAGRIRMEEEEEPPLVEVKIAAPGQEVSLEAGFTIDDDPNVVRYAGKKAAVFVVHGPVFATKQGLVEINIKINDAPARRLAFSVSEANASD